MKNYLAIGLAVVMIAACGDKGAPKTVAPAPLAPQQNAQPTVVPTPPAPPNAVDDGIQRPMPGQAGDTSSAEFKDGGKPDPKK
jgi:PBP1b-binding outer membrane lipoprotein LpoB